MYLKNLHIAINGTTVVPDLSLQLASGTVHAIMGPNGSGKSSLAYALLGHPTYCLAGGTILLDSIDITNQAPDERARAGIFLAYQQPIALPGVTVFTLLSESWRALGKPPRSVPQMRDSIFDALALLGLDASFIDRAVHDGFSGGEKKRFEMVQAVLLKPRVIILDEIDSGLDLDALTLVGRCLQVLQRDDPATRIIIITHYPRILRYVRPDHVHLMYKGALALSADASLVERIELHGYDLEKLKQ